MADNVSISVYPGEGVHTCKYSSMSRTLYLFCPGPKIAYKLPT